MWDLQEGGHPASLGPQASGCQNLLSFLFVPPGWLGLLPQSHPHPESVPFLGGFEGTSPTAVFLLSLPPIQPRLVAVGAPDRGNILTGE